MQGLEEKLVEQLRANLQGKSVVSTPPSSQAGRQVLEYWAGQPGLEATYLLENVFLLYYSDHAGMQASRFVQLANLFNASLFSVWPVLVRRTSLHSTVEIFFSNRGCIALFAGSWMYRFSLFSAMMYEQTLSHKYHPWSDRTGRVQVFES